MSKLILLWPLVLLATLITVDAKTTYDEGVKVIRLLRSRKIVSSVIPIPPNTTDPLEVKAHFIMQSLVDVDSHLEVMRLTASIILVWNDFNLKWTVNDSKSTWASIAAKKVWYPVMLLKNSVGERSYARPDPRFDDLLIHPNGRVILRMYYTFDTKCNAKVFKFPRDTMVCKLTFVSPLSSLSMLITADNSTQDDMLAFDNDDAEWRVTSLTFTSNEEHLNALNAKYTFSAVTAEIKVIRSVGYYLVIVQLPIMLLSTMIVVASFISVAGGERLGFVTQICLTYIVFLLLLDSILPKSHFPLLSLCVVICFCLTVINVVETVVVRKFLSLSKDMKKKDEHLELANLQDKYGDGNERLEVKRWATRRPWLKYAFRIDRAMLIFNVVIVLIVIILNIGIIYS